MAETNAERREVNARIVYWGLAGAGKSANLRAIHQRLRPDHRGQLEERATPLDPTASYELLPIELGEIAGLRTRIQIVSVPGAPELAPTRKQLLDRSDGVVFVVDASRDRVDQNLQAFDELRAALAAYGRSIDEVPLVVQYNKRDVSDPIALEALHRKLDLGRVPVFEAVATEGTGVLQTLTTISKHVVRALREGGEAAALGRPQADELERAALETDDLLEDHPAEALATRAQGLLQADWSALSADLDELSAPGLESEGWHIAAAGAARVELGNRVSVPLVLADGAGRELRFRLTVSLESAPEE